MYWSIWRLDPTNSYYKLTVNLNGWIVNVVFEIKMTRQQESKATLIIKPASNWNFSIYGPKLKEEREEGMETGKASHFVKSMDVAEYFFFFGKALFLSPLIIPAAGNKMDESERQESLINTFVLFSYVNCLFILTQRVPRTDLSDGSV